MKIVAATSIIQWFLEKYKYSAITMPWKTIYVLEHKIGDTGLINHEKVHIAQIERMGAIKFTVSYLYYNIRYGYWNNPLEIEARQVSGHN